MDSLEKHITGRRSLGSLDRAVHVAENGEDRYYFCGELRHRRMTPMLARIHAKAQSHADYVRENGEKYVYVVRGSVELHSEYYQPLALTAGESVYFDSSMAHIFIAADGCDEATLLAISSIP